ncbi:MAG TPA: hypothetical protein VF409_08850, partial [Sphingomonas sp.]
TPNGATPAKRVLKPSERYSAADAYNAICDLRSLNILIRLIGAFPDEAIQLCTADKNLALFWCGLGADDFASGPDAGDYTISLHPALMPAEDALRYYDAVQAG